MEKEVSVSRFLDFPGALRGKSGGFLQELRQIIHQVRMENPQLAGYRLQDFGLIRHVGSLEIKMYFRNTAMQELVDKCQTIKE